MPNIIGLKNLQNFHNNKKRNEETYASYLDKICRSWKTQSFGLEKEVGAYSFVYRVIMSLWINNKYRKNLT